MPESTWVKDYLERSGRAKQPQAAPESSTWVKSYLERSGRAKQEEVPAWVGGAVMGPAGLLPQVRQSVLAPLARGANFALNVLQAPVAMTRQLGEAAPWLERVQNFPDLSASPWMQVVPGAQLAQVASMGLRLPITAAAAILDPRVRRALVPTARRVGEQVARGEMPSENIEYYQRHGYPLWYSMSRGLAEDIVTDPLFYVHKGVGEVAAAGRQGLLQAAPRIARALEAATAAKIGEQAAAGVRPALQEIATWAPQFGFFAARRGWPVERAAELAGAGSVRMGPQLERAGVLFAQGLLDSGIAQDEVGPLWRQVMGAAVRSGGERAAQGMRQYWGLGITPDFMAPLVPAGKVGEGIAAAGRVLIPEKLAAQIRPVAGDLYRAFQTGVRGNPIERMQGELIRENLSGAIQANEEVVAELVKQGVARPSAPAGRFVLSGLSYSRQTVPDFMAEIGERLKDTREAQLLDGRYGIAAQRFEALDPLASQLAEEASTSNFGPFSRLQRWDRPGVAGDLNKPEGLYLSPAGSASPYADGRGVRSDFIPTARNVLDVSDVPPTPIREGAPDSDAGVRALRKLDYAMFVRLVYQTPESQILSEVRKLLPGADVTRFRDAQDMLSVIGAELSRRRGYDAIINRNPRQVEYSEYVALTAIAIRRPVALQGLSRGQLLRVTTARDALPASVDYDTAFGAIRDALWKGTQDEIAEGKFKLGVLAETPDRHVARALKENAWLRQRLPDFADQPKVLKRALLREQDFGLAATGDYQRVLDILTERMTDLHIELRPLSFHQVPRVELMKQAARAAIRKLEDFGDDSVLMRLIREELEGYVPGQHPSRGVAADLDDNLRTWIARMLREKHGLPPARDRVNAVLGAWKAGASGAAAKWQAAVEDAVKAARSTVDKSGLADELRQDIVARIEGRFKDAVRKAMTKAGVALDPQSLVDFGRQWVATKEGQQAQARYDRAMGRVDGVVQYNLKGAFAKAKKAKEDFVREQMATPPPDALDSIAFLWGQLGPSDQTQVANDLRYLLQIGGIDSPPGWLLPKHAPSAGGIPFQGRQPGFSQQQLFDHPFKAFRAGLPSELDILPLMLRRTRQQHGAEARRRLGEVAIGWGIPEAKAVTDPQYAQYITLEQAAQHAGSAAPTAVTRIWPELNGLRFNPDTAAGLVRARAEAFRDPGLNWFYKLWDRYIRSWKAGATIASPVWMLVNLHGNLYNNFLRGLTNPVRYLEGAALATDNERVRNGLAAVASNMPGSVLRQLDNRWVLDLPTGQMPIEELHRVAREHAWFSGWATQELRPASVGHMSRLMEVLSKSANPLSPEFVTSGAIRNASIWIEDISKLGLGIDRLAKGNTAEEAARVIAHTLFDYSNLTGVERMIRGAPLVGLPFYTWLKNNIALQLHTMMEHPGWSQVLPRMVRDLEYTVPPDRKVDKSLLPSWFQEDMTFQLPWLDRQGRPLFATVRLPLMDLNRMTQIGMILSMFGPPKQFAEVKANYSTFYGGPIDPKYRYAPPEARLKDETWVKAPWWIKDAPKSMYFGQLAYGPSQRPGGYEVKIKRRTLYLLENTFPQLARASRLGPVSTPGGEPSSIEVWGHELPTQKIQLVTGVAVRPLDVRRQRAFLKAQGQYERGALKRRAVERGERAVPPGYWRK